MSRPRKECAASLSRRIIFRLTPAQYDELEAQARRADLSVHQLARQLTAEKSSKLVINTTSRFDPAYIAQLKKIGHNLNQLVKNAHIFGRVSPKVGPLCDKIAAIILAAIEEETQD